MPTPTYADPQRGLWVYDDYEKRYCLFAKDPYLASARICILTIPPSVYQAWPKFYETIGPMAVQLFEAAYPSR